MSCDRTVWRICRDNGWVVSVQQAAQTGRPGTPSHDDLVNRGFTATAPNRLWLTDITEHRTDEGKLYCCAAKDVFSNRIVGYSIDSRMKASLAVAAVDMAAARVATSLLVLHSDRGSQFRARNCTALSRHGIVGSMVVGSAGDNAAMESLALLQKNVLTGNAGPPRRSADRIITWIERTYHRRRRQARLGRLTPSTRDHHDPRHHSGLTHTTCHRNAAVPPRQVLLSSIYLFAQWRRCLPSHSG